jgi:hypothetical protein
MPVHTISSYPVDSMRVVCIWVCHPISLDAKQFVGKMSALPFRSGGLVKQCLNPDCCARILPQRQHCSNIRFVPWRGSSWEEATRGYGVKHPKADVFKQLTWDDTKAWAGIDVTSRGQSYQREHRIQELAVTSHGSLWHG